MKRRTRVVLLLIAAGTSFSAAPAPASSATPQPIPAACIYQVLTSISGRTTGYKGTSETSKQVAGPVEIDHTGTSTASQTFGVSVSATVEAGVIIAKAEQTFGVDYSYNTSSSASWGYHTVIPAGKTGLMAVLHKNDRDGFSQVFKYENCTTRRVDAYAYIPVASRANVALRT